jgi:hypothetical protein
MKTNHSSEGKVKKTLKTIAKYGITLGTAAYMSGCASMNYDIKPSVSFNGGSGEGIEGRIGMTIGGQDSKHESKAGEYPVGHGGFWFETWNTIRSPFYIYRCADGKWMPEWREHPVRTAVATVAEVGIGYALSQGGGKGGSSNSGTTTTTTSTTSTSSTSGSTSSSSSTSSTSSTASTASTSTTTSTSDSSSGATSTTSVSSTTSD